MSTHVRSNTKIKDQAGLKNWIGVGLVTAVASAVVVVLVRAIALAIWPDLAVFKPLDSAPRAALFTIIPALAATGLMAWLTRTRQAPVKTFLVISGIVLVLSFIPDYVLPVENKTFLASTVTAFLHVVAAVVIVPVLAWAGNARSSAPTRR